jgi:hypothetical protein
VVPTRSPDSHQTRNKVREALNAMGIEFIDGDTPGVILRHKDKAADGKSTRPARAVSKKATQRKAR